MKRMGGSRSYSANPSDYKLLEEVGYGASATVYRAIYIPFNDVVAIKCLDLDRCNSNLSVIREVVTGSATCRSMCASLCTVISCSRVAVLIANGPLQDDMRREAQTMSLIDHPNDGTRGLAARKADIWSFGITALELAHGHAPFSKYPPMKVLLMTIQNAPPGLDYDRDKKFSKSFKEMVAMCLVKDQTKRPTAEKLLKHSFFKHAKPPELSLKKLFTDLPPLWNRVKALQLKDAAQLALKKMPSAEQEALSQSEYQRGVSAWNFDIEDLKAQASLVRDDDDIHECKDDESLKSSPGHKAAAYCESSLGKLNLDREVSQVEFGGPRSVDSIQPDCLNETGKNLDCDRVEKGLRKNGSNIDVMASTSEKDVGLAKSKTVKPRQTRSGPVLNHSSSDRVRNSERFENENLPANEKVCQVRKAPSFSGPLMLPNRASANSLSAPIKSSGGFRESLDDKSKANLVQIKGRFSVTSENLDLVKDIPLSSVSRRSSQTSPLRKSASVGDWMFESKQVPISQSPKDLTNGNVPASILMTHLQNLFQQTSLQQDLIVNLLNTLQSAEAVDASQNGKLPPLPRSESNGNVETPASERERLLLGKITELQSRMMNLTDELTAEKLKHDHLQQQLRFVSGVEENGIRREVDA
ncbi:serine/threonine-protein kinase OSR1-like [Gossypium australe]|uniref:Serine/threonine-protein kinase OSR1-like n=1 Tax=Gossypium australe TaxID=47621 RepID=A0A5B6W1Z4_9ROSI|nr:serine/threonine-protein kinase OSR1-like [Gossypium australe]